MIATGLARKTDLLAMGSEMRRLRNKAGLSPQEMAQKVGLSYKHYFNIEAAVCWPSFPAYISICRALGVERLPLVG